MTLGSLNPVFLFILFAMGYVFGLLLKNPTAGKFLIFGFFGIFIYQPVRDTGLAASGAFVFGIILHHLNLFDVLRQMPEFRLPRFSFRSKSGSAYSQSQDHQQDYRQQRSAETEDETHRKYEDYVNRKRREEAQDQARANTGSEQSHQGSARSGAGDNQAEREAMRQEKERLRREKARLDAERRRFEQKKAVQDPSGNRSHEEVLGLFGNYTLKDLKEARKQKLQAWHPDKLQGIPEPLRKQADEEMKMINLAFEQLRKKFG